MPLTSCSCEPCHISDAFQGFAGNDSPSFVFPTAIATKGGVGGSGGSGSGRPAVANKPSFLTGTTGGSGSLAVKRGTEDLDFFIGDEALIAASGPGIPSLCPRRVLAVVNYEQGMAFIILFVTGKWRTG